MDRRSGSVAAVAQISGDDRYVANDALPPEKGNPDTTIGGERFREAGPGDATALLALKRKLDRETSLMLLEPDERTETEQDVAGDLERLAGSNSVVIVAEGPAGIVGYVDARGGEFRRNRITAYVVIGVLATASGHGVGSGLLRAVERWAPAHGIHRLELTVMARNERAARLYERMGFEVEGRRRECLTVDEELADELYMGKLLPVPTD
jgi:RimJ/RimL family protein N-acetyltransferase